MKNAKQLFRNAFLFLGIFSLLTFVSCKEEEAPIPDPIASFQYEINNENYLMVKFNNFSQNATSFSWNFGDGETSTDENPTHTYAKAGNYTVVLVASNSDNTTHNYTQSIEITDPNEALTLLAGQTSKTWKLYRVDNSMGVGPNVDDPYQWWSLQNDGARPCVYQHEFTFHRNGTYKFDDKGVFWGEGFPEPLRNTCFAAIPANMVNSGGADVKAWLSGTHSFTFVPATGMVTLNGTGAWIGLPKTGTSGEVAVPQQSVSFKINISEHTGYDLMQVWFLYDGVVWRFNYASYSNPALEPALVTVAAPWGEDLADITPNALGHTFESATSFDLLGTIGGASNIIVGENDPANATGTKVGKFERTAERYQEAQLRIAPDPKDIIFTNFKTVSIDVYLPSSNTYDPLTKKVIIGFGDMSQTEQWWNGLIQYESNELALDQWVTVTFELDKPSYSSTEGQTPFDRQDLDMIFVQIGGTDHTTPGVFYVRNLIFK
jgi:PKD repeat protein